MEAENEYEIKRARDAVQMIQTIQSMIDVSADRLKGLRTQCLTSAELTQQEIRTLEGKLVKHFSRQLVIKERFGDELKKELGDVPCLEQWLRVVGLGPESIEAVCSRVATLEALRERTDHELRALLPRARDEEVRRLCRAMHRLRTYIDALARGDGGAELQLYWDSWERQRGSPRARARASVPADESPGRRRGKSPSTPLSRRRQQLPAPAAALAKSRSHESQLSLRPDAHDMSDTTSQSSALNTSEASPPPTPHDAHANHANHARHNNVNNVGHWSVPRSPRTPTAPLAAAGCMAHDIAHRFAKSFSMLATCDYCDKQIFLGNGLKCKECKFKCHRDCESKVPPSCGLPPELIVAFREKVYKDGGYYGAASPVSGRAAGAGFLSSLSHRPRRRHRAASNANTFPHWSAVPPGGPDSSSNTSSCNSSTPSSPALAPAAAAPATPVHPNRQQFHFPEVKQQQTSSPNQTPTQSPQRNSDNREELTNSVKSADSSQYVSLSGSTSTDSGHTARADSVDKNGDARWPRQNSLSMKEWDIPYDELKLFEAIGAGRFGTVYRGCWHGAVAVRLLHVPELGCIGNIDTFKHEVATFRKTRHENLVLFMGACMKPPKLAIVTSLCKGMTLHQLLHLRREKFTPNKSVLVAQQISQGMGYLHARGIIHKDLKTKNIFLENGKVVITDFGLFSVAKLCFENNDRGDTLGIPQGWLCYLAPELIRALRPDASARLPFAKPTDVYAFGTVWYELLCGEWPFAGQPAEAVIWQVGRGVRQSLAQLQASRDIKEILMMCWSFRPSDRPDFSALLCTVQKLPRKRLARSPSHPVHLSRSADSVL